MSNLWCEKIVHFMIIDRISNPEFNTIPQSGLFTFKRIKEVVDTKPDWVGNENKDNTIQDKIEERGYGKDERYREEQKWIKE